MDKSQSDSIVELFTHHFTGMSKLALSFANIAEIVEYKKFDIIKESGSKEDYISLILKGSAGSFVNYGNKDICLDLSLTGDFIAEYEGFLTREPSVGYVKALESTTLARVEIFSERWQDIPGFKTLMEKSLIFMFIDRQQRLISILSKNPEERYNEMLEQYPRFINEVSQTVLASWLGISREHLSRIRSR